MKKYLLITIFLSLIFLTIILVFNYRFRLNFLYSIGLSKKSYCDFEIRNVREYDFEKGRIQKLKKELSEVELKTNLLDSPQSQARYQLFQRYKEAGVTQSKTFEDYEIQRIQNLINSLEEGRRIYYEAYIQNNSSYTQKLKAILGKTITNEGIVLEEGYTENKVTLSPGESTKIKFQIDYFDAETIKNYIESDVKNYNIKLYPWFETCEY